MNRRFYRNAFLLSLCLVLAACSGSAGTSGSSAVTISISRGNGPAGSGAPGIFKAPAVAGLVFTISASDMATITRTATISAAQTVTETFEAPNGTGRQFVVEAKDAGGVAVYQGSATADLTGAAVTLDIRLSPVVFLGTRLLGTAQDDFGMAGARDGSGNIYIAGITHGELNNPLSTGPAITGNAFFTKFSQFGEPLFTRQFGTTNGTFAFSMAVDGSGNIVVAGGTGGNLDGEANNGFTDGFVAKFDSSGNRLWTTLVGGAGDDVVNAVAVDASGNVYATGFSGAGSVLPGNQSSGGQDVFVVKMNPSGTVQWTKQYGSAQVDSGEAISVDPSGNVYAAGLTFGNLDADLNAQNVNKDASGATADAFVSKIDASGLIRITGQFGTADSDQASAIAVGAAGLVYVAGQTSGNLEGQVNADPSGIKSDVFLVKFDAAAAVPALQFARLIGTSENDVVGGITVDAADNVFLAGSTGGAFAGNTSAGGDDAVVIKVSPAGDVVWTRQFGTPDNDEAKAVLADAANNVLVAGTTKGVFDGIQSFSFDAFLIMYDENGV